MAMHKADTARAIDREHSIEYRLMYTLVYVVCLFTAVIRRVIPIGEPASRASEQRATLSLLLEARTAASSVVPYVFQV